MTRVDHLDAYLSALHHLAWLAREDMSVADAHKQHVTIHGLRWRVFDVLDEVAERTDLGAEHPAAGAGFLLAAADLLDLVGADADEPLSSEALSLSERLRLLADPDEPTEETEDDTVGCPECLGRGRLLLETDECALCAGRGRVPPEVARAR